MWSQEDLLSSLRALGLLRSPDLERALRSVRQEPFLPEPFASLAYADMPLPTLTELHGPTIPSPRCLVSALGLLEPTRETRTLVVGARGGYPVALLAAIVPPDRIVVAEPDEELRRVTTQRLEAAGLAAVRVLPVPPPESFERILVMDLKGPSPRELSGCLADMGFLISRGRGVHDLAFVKVIRSGGETVQMTFNEAPSPVLAGPRSADNVNAVDFGRLFAVEDLLAHAWQGLITGHYDQHFRDVVDETFKDGPLDPAMEEEPPKRAALRAFQAAYILQSAGELERAADAYERSICLAPSAEAHTFLGWTYSFMGRYDDAIAECQRAIDVDPAFGNPYNDIGAYLIEQGRLDEAIPWLEKAITATRYCCYFYAHTNLARVYVQQGMREKARKSLHAALRVNPGYEPARELLRRLDGHTDYFA
ncbi:MAG: tetratricopeptide repeat protein [Thermoplasmata archaeon]